MVPKGEGWIKMHRKVLDNPVIMKDPQFFMVWHYLLYTAVYESTPIDFNGSTIYLKPGQMTLGRSQIAKELKISESKIQRILSRLESEQQIEQQTNNRFRLVTICNWNEYQGVSEQPIEQQMNSQRTASEQQLNTNKEYKNIRIKEDRSECGILAVFSSGFGRSLTVDEHELISADIEIFGEDKVRAAAEEAFVYGAKSYAYVHKVLLSNREAKAKPKEESFVDIGRRLQAKLDAKEEEARANEFSGDWRIAGSSKVGIPANVEKRPSCRSLGEIASGLQLPRDK